MNSCASYDYGLGQCCLFSTFIFSMKKFKRKVTTVEVEHEVQHEFRGVVSRQWGMDGGYTPTSKDVVGKYKFTSKSLIRGIQVKVDRT